MMLRGASLWEVARFFVVEIPYAVYLYGIIRRDYIYNKIYIYICNILLPTHTNIYTIYIYMSIVYKFVRVGDYIYIYIYICMIIYIIIY